VNHTIDGIGLERWFLKTLINLSNSQGYYIGRGSPTKGTPSDELVRIAYGLSDFAAPAGLYMVGQVGEKIVSMDRVSFAPLIDSPNVTIVGGLFRFRGSRFLLYLEAIDPSVTMKNIVLDGKSWGTAQMSRHLQTIRVEDRGQLSQRVTFKW
jgi:hypothetical protein